MKNRKKALPFARRSPGDARLAGQAVAVTLIDGRTVRLERVACCLCGVVDEQPIALVTDWRYGLTRDLFRIVRCRRCGLAYLNPRPVRDEIALFYPGRYYERRHAAAGAAPPEARRLGAEALAEQEALCLPVESGSGPPRLLDVGCASGTFLARMRERGWEVQGVEVSLEAAEWGSREQGLDIIGRPLTEAGLPAQRYDVVTFWSSLEHVHDPPGYLAEAHRLLKPGGRAIILIPNLASPTVRRLHWGLDPPRHLYHFTPRVLERALRAAGFDGPVDFRARTRIENGSFHRQVAKIGRRLRRHAGSGAGAAAGRLLVWASPALAPVSWALTAAGLNGAMIVTARKRARP